MKLEQQVTSLDLARKMKGLGFVQESLWWWRDDCGGGLSISKYPPNPNNDYKCGCKYYSAYTVAELGEMLPKNKVAWAGKTVSGEWRIDEQDGGHTGAMILANTEANARAKMLIHLKEKGVI